ncbi:MAG TPA: hypothetical protein VKA92_07650 [Segetibacter sp.]|nr:hypothetical protein [Segetibacter sp.]
MKTNNMKQEILLAISTTHTKRQLCKRSDSERSRNFSSTEQLEDACWNGLLYELFPQIMNRTASGKRLFIWHIRHRFSCLKIELSELDSSTQKEFSIDANSFISTIIFN